MEPKHGTIEYGRSRRPHNKFIEGEVENIPLPSEHFDKIVASASFHHFPNQDKGLEEMKRVLKTNGKMLLLGLIQIQEGESGCRFVKIYLHTGAKLYEPTQIREKVEDHGLEVLYIKPTTLAYFLIAVKKVFKNK